MRCYPVFLNAAGRRVLISGAGGTASAKLRLVMKLKARIVVYGATPDADVRGWAEAGRITLIERPLQEGDAICAAMLYAANDDAQEDARVAAIGRRAGALVNIVDNLEQSDFITPAMVDRDPVVVAIGTEGAAPVLARRIKQSVEEMLAADLGVLARAGQAFRAEAERAPKGAPRRRFWARYYDEVGPAALAAEGEAGLRPALERLLAETLTITAAPGRVALISAGPGDPEELTLRARRLLHEADVVLHDRLVDPRVLELARREAKFVEVGKTPGGPSWRQSDIEALMIAEARDGAFVARLKSGDAGMFGRLEEELDALDAAGISYEVAPGVTSAAAAAARIGASLTRRGRNASITFITGQDAAGFAEQDWRAAARPGQVTAIYMGLRAARFIQGRLLMHGGASDTPVTAVENASRADERVVSTTLERLPEALEAAGAKGPAILFIGLSPRRALAALDAADPEEIKAMGAL
ncbi:MAG: siroheme synthase CysG [Neomegalonema sp.]|nr:siroheme synthase CysG [Neomegalonema sp.]